jgi:hypothetical protein
MAFLESSSDSRKFSFLALFIPLLRPRTRADGISILTQRFAGVFVLLLGAEQPFVVSIPAMQGLVRAGEALITGSCAGLFDLVQASRLLFVELRNRRFEDLKQGTDESSKVM